MAVISTNNINLYFNGVFQNNMCSQLVYLTGILDKLIIHNVALSSYERMYGAV